MEETFLTAQNHEEIKRWILKHHGKPAIIDDPNSGSDEIGIRVDFPGKKDEELLSSDRNQSSDTSWERFFEILESKNLDFTYIDDPKYHDLTESYMLVPR